MNTIESAVEVLKTEYKLPVTSVVQTMQELGERTLDWEVVIAKLYGVKEITPFKNDDLAKCVGRYFIQNILRQHAAGEYAEFPRNLEELYLNSINQASDYIEKNSWVFARPEVEERLNADGTPAPKKGDKKTMAIEWWKNLKDKNIKRKDAIKQLVELTGMSDAGASTYYANLKSGKYE